MSKTLKRSFSAMLAFCIVIGTVFGADPFAYAENTQSDVAVAVQSDTQTPPDTAVSVGEAEPEEAASEPDSGGEAQAFGALALVQMRGDATDSQKMNFGISIDRVGTGVDGDLEFKQNKISIYLDILTGKTSYDVLQTIQGINIDDLEYPMRSPDPRNPDKTLPNFIALQDELAIYDAYEAGKIAYQDFTSRDAHKVVITFKDGSSVEYRDSGYVTPQRNSNPFDQGSVTPEPPTVNGIAAQYEIKAVEIGEYGDLAIAFSKDNDDKKIENSHVEEIKSIKVNDILFDPPPGDMRRHWSGKLISSDEKIVEAARKGSPIAIEITFKDGSVLKNNASPVEQPREVKVYLIHENGKEMSMADRALVRTATISPSSKNVGPFKGYDVLLRFNELTISGITTGVEELSYEAMTTMRKATPVEGENGAFTFAIPSVSVKPESSPEDTDIKVQMTIKGLPITPKATLKIDWNGDFVPFSGNTNPPNNGEDPQPPNNGGTTPAAPIGGEYTVRDAKVEKAASEFSKDKLIILFAEGKDISNEHVQAIKAVKINDRTFEKSAASFFKNRDGGIYSESSAVVEEFQKHQKIKIEIVFSDDSVLTFEKTNDQGGTTPAAPIGNEYSIRDAKVEKAASEFSKDKLIILFAEGKDISNEHVQAIKAVKINDQTFEKGKDASFFKNRDGGIYSETPVVVEEFQKHQKIKIEIIFNDGSVLVFEKTNDQGGTTQPPTNGSSASLFELNKVELDTNEKTFDVYFKKAIPDNYKELISRIRVNGTWFDFENITFTLSGSKKVLFTSNPTLYEAGQRQEQIALEILFKDGSSVKIGELANDPGEFNLSDSLENGEYTLTYKAYMLGSNQQTPSSIGGYFDVRVKLVVDQGVKTVSFLNHKFSDLILDFAIQKEGGFESLQKKVLSQEDGYVEYSIALAELSGTKIGAFLVNMPGTGSGTVGAYEGYQKAEIVFDSVVTKGWEDYKVIQDQKIAKSENDRILYDKLVANGVEDADKDGRLSPEELQNAKGITTQKELFEGFPTTGVLDLEAKPGEAKITDISILKDLGPAIRGINLNGNAIEALPSNVFSKATGLTHIVLGANKITTIDKTAFEGATALKYLDLEGNPISELPDGVFDTNTKLRDLALVGTNLRSVPNGLIAKNTSLERLYMYENKLESLPDDFFANNARLREVHLFSNMLTSLPSSLGGSDKLRLELINASRNRLTSVPTSLGELKSLAVLDLEYNQLSDIPSAILTGLIRNSGNNISAGIDLSSNNLTSLPVDEMLSALNAGGRALKKFEVDKNFLPGNLDSEKEEQLKTLGVSFENKVEVYYPQKTSIQPKITAENLKVKLSQQFDLLELLYWDLGDIPRYGGKDVFKSDEEFLKYLLEEGRDHNKISRDMDRADAVKMILEGRSIKWEIETIVTKNNTEVIYSNRVTGNPKEGIIQEFGDPSMKSGDRYTVTKVLYVENVLGWTPFIRFSAEGIASGTVTPPNPPQEGEEISVQINKVGSDEVSVMANQAINPKARLVQRDNKWIYTVELKPIQVPIGTQTLRGEVISFKIKEGDQFRKIEPKEITGEYTKAYTFELPEQVQRLTVELEIDAMNQMSGGNPAPVQADLVFNSATVPKPPTPSEGRTVKGFILQDAENKLSHANSYLESITVHATDKKAGPFKLYEVKINFKEPESQGQKSGVSSFAIRLQEKWMPAKAVDGKPGSFVIEMPEAVIKADGFKTDTIWNVQFTTYGAHDGVKTARLLLDWNNDFSADSGNVNPPNNGGGTIPIVPQEETLYPTVWLKNKNTGQPSMANGALQSPAKVVKNQNRYTYTITLRPVEIEVANQGKLRGEVTRFSVNTPSGMQQIYANSNGEYTFELNKKVNELLVEFEVDIMKNFGMGAQEAYIVFNWSGGYVPSGSGGGGGAITIPENLIPLAQTPGDITAATKKAERLLQEKESNKKYYSAETLEAIAKALEAVKNKEDGAEIRLAKVLKGAKQERIATVLGRGYMSGYPNKEFRPKNNITRAEVAAMFAELIDDEAEVKLSFSDVKANEWYSEVVTKIASLGLIRPNEDKTFTPNKPITRGEFAYIIAKIKNLPAGSRELPDVPKEHFAANEIAAVVEAGIIAGYKDGSVKPDQPITRAEAVAMLSRAFASNATAEGKESYSDVPTTHWAYEVIMKASKSGNN